MWNGNIKIPKLISWVLSSYNYFMDPQSSCAFESYIHFKPLEIYVSTKHSCKEINLNEKKYNAYTYNTYIDLILQIFSSLNTPKENKCRESNHLWNGSTKFLMVILLIPIVFQPHMDSWSEHKSIGSLLASNHKTVSMK